MQVHRERNVRLQTGRVRYCFAWNRAERLLGCILQIELEMVSKEGAL